MIFPSLLLAGDKARTICVQHTGQATKDAQQIARYGNVASDHDLDLNIAKASPAKPRVHIIVGPEGCIDDIEDIEHQEPANQARRGEVPILPVQSHRDQADQDGQGRENRNDHCIGRNVIARLRL